MPESKDLGYSMVKSVLIYTPTAAIATFIGANILDKLNYKTDLFFIALPFHLGILAIVGYYSVKFRRLIKQRNSTNSYEK